MRTVLRERVPGQYAARDGTEPEHTHPEISHVHDHYHVSHVHAGEKTPDWEHQSDWHTHTHEHGPITHSHELDRVGEEQHHGSRAHNHRHQALEELAL